MAVREWGNWRERILSEVCGEWGRELEVEVRGSVNWETVFFLGDVS